jgi:DNA-3-methyladenine glycosylase II
VCNELRTLRHLPTVKSKPNTPTTLYEKRLAVDAHSLASIDQDMARILENHGVPPLWAREPGFTTLIRIIVEQQVSLASADAMFRRLQDNIDPLTPATVIAAGSTYLRTLGITRQKATYFINVAEAVQNGGLDFEKVGEVSDESAIATLTSIKGIGPWTAKVYLLMALCRPDVWPVGDIALATAFKNLKGWSERPTQPELTVIAIAWAPYRATAARMLWNYYLKGMTG